MQISENGLNLIKKFEGCKLVAYKDPIGVWTIGYGITNSDRDITNTIIKQGLVISQATADKWLQESINKKYIPLVEKYNSKYNFNQNQIDALVSFAYNVGSIDQLTANGTRTINEIANHILAYNKAGGIELLGLTKRRQAEKNLFLTPVSIVQNQNIDIFDCDLYNSLYIDLQKAFKGNVEKLRQHFETCGVLEGRRFSYVFDVHYYFAKYEDLRRNIGANCQKLYEHFITCGIKEGRKGCAEFDVSFYKNYNKDLSNMSNEEAVKHFLIFGLREGRIASSDFNVLKYKENYKDLRDAFKDNMKEYFKHYILFGKNENRRAV